MPDGVVAADTKQPDAPIRIQACFQVQAKSLSYLAHRDPRGIVLIHKKSGQAMPTVRSLACASIHLKRRPRSPETPSTID
jgi:hypothetical protein